MTRTLLALAAAALLLTSTRAPAQEKYTLKFKEPGAGDTFTHTRVSTEKGVTKITDAQGKALPDTVETKGEDYSYTTTVLKKAAGEPEPTSLRRTYARAEETKNGKTTTLEVAGKTVLIEKKDGKFTFRYEGGGDVTGAALAKLHSEFNDPDPSPDKLLLPRKAVAVGETWTIETDIFKKGLKPDAAKVFDLDKVKATGKLLKAYKKNGAQFAVMEITLEMPLRENSEIAKGYVVLGGKAILKGTMDACVDGTSFARSGKYTMEMDMRATLDMNGMRLAITAQSSKTGTDSTEDGGKK